MSKVRNARKFRSIIMLNLPCLSFGYHSRFSVRYAIFQMEKTKSAMHI